MTFSIIVVYLVLLLFLGVGTSFFFRKTSGDFFLASRGIGPFMLLMSIFGTTMTAFALIGSTGKTFQQGIGVYGLMASWSGIVHAAIFFLVGAKVWSLGAKHGYLTQLAYFRDRYRSDLLAILLFVLGVVFVMVYILMGVIGSGRFLEAVTAETWSRSDVRTSVTLAASPSDLKIPEAWASRLEYDEATRTLTLVGSAAPKRKPQLMAFSADPAWKQGAAQLVDQAPRGALAKPWGMAIICCVVLFYVFFGGMRATAWANTLQTLVFMVMGVVAFIVITRAMGGPVEATNKLLAHETGSLRMAREGLLGKTQFLTYCFIPLSVGMFPHLFQHWLTAKRASNFKLTVVAHPICILITWLPCVLLGMWASGLFPLDTNPNSVLGMMVSRFSGDVLAGFIGAGVLAAIMSSMDSQFLCLSSLFTNDIVARYFAKGLSDRTLVGLGRAFVVLVVLVAYLIGLKEHQSVFNLGVWCFTGFAGLAPVLFASLYWKRSNAAGAIASVLTVGVFWCVYLPNVLRTSGGEEEEFLFFTEYFSSAGQVDGLMPVTVLVALSTAVLVVVTLVTPAPNRSIVEKFFPKRS